VDGEQVPGEVNSEVAETIAAEERVASESIDRDEIPRQHQKAVKQYFSTLTRKLAKAGTTSPSEVSDSTEAPSTAESNDESADE
jgi:hypothetical protein